MNIAREGSLGAKQGVRGPVPRLLTGRKILAAVADIMCGDDQAIAAVAYWGPRGISGTGLLKRDPEKTRILCDLFSGACNPKAIRDLVTAGIRVKTVDGLHSKVWSCGDRTIIGSANASANGMGYEDAEIKHNEEAAALVTDLRFSGDVRAWFDGLWKDPSRARSVRSEEIDSAIPIWLATRRTRHRQQTDTLLDIMKTAAGRALAKKVRVIAYTGTATSPQAKKAYKGLVGIYAPEALALYPGEEPYYEDETSWDLKPGELLLDYYCSRKRATPQFTGIYQVRRDHPYAKAATPEIPLNRIILCEPLLDLSGHRLSPTEQRLIGVKLKQSIETRGWEADKNGNYFDAPLATLL